MPLGLFKASIPIGLKAFKYFIDSAFRDKVTPVPGSVLYCDLWLAVEHSGIYVGEGEISNIVVDGVVQSTVSLSSPESFTSKSKLGKKIYVSCNKYGAVGDEVVAEGANTHVGESAFYGLVIKNCHQFSTRCVSYVGDHLVSKSLVDGLLAFLPDETFEPTMAKLKQTAKSKLGATKWRLWDWQNDSEEQPSEPDWEAHNEHFKNQTLNEKSIAEIRAELAAVKAYEEEVSDENIPKDICTKLELFRKSLSDISNKYDEVKDFLAASGASFTYNELKACGEDFAALAQQLKNNSQIHELAKKMGRNYISEEKKKQNRIPQANKSEVHGTHRSDDLMRVLPSELVNLEDENLEILFYARLLEKNLLSYELSGTSLVNGETIETTKKRTGPVVACLDTSGSMNGEPLVIAKALLLAIANILKEEDRSLYVVLFSASDQIREFAMDATNNSAGLLKFLQEGFGGGTDFEAPLQRALGIIESQYDYKKADMLMISDGDCSLSPEFTKKLKADKKRLDCSVYSVLCAGARVEDTFSDEVIVLSIESNRKLNVPSSLTICMGGG